MSSFFERNTSLKIISITIALILWGMTPSNRDPLRDWSFRDIPLKIENRQKLSENGLMISSEVPDTYSFDVRAKGSTFKFIDKGKVFALMDLEDINKTGEQKVKVTIEGLPSNIEVKSLPDIKINVERIVSKNIPISPKIMADDQKESDKRYYEINPKFVEVRGPETLIENVSYGQVTFSLGEKDKKIERSMAVELFNEKDEIIESDFISTNPEYCVVSIFPYKSVKIEPIIIGKPAEGYKVIGEEIEPGEILVSGDPKVLDSLESVPTEILDIEGVTANITRKLNLEPQEEIRINPGQSSNVQVLIRIEKVVDRTVDVGNIETRNVPDGMRVNFEKPEGGMAVTLRGPQSLVAAIKPGDLKVFLDLNDSSRGERSYKVFVDNLPEGIEVSKVEPKSAKVKIE